jgi:hypothetical protein
MINVNLNKTWAKASLNNAIKYGVIINGILVGIRENHINYYNRLCSIAINANTNCMLKSLDSRVYTLSPEETLHFLNKYNNTHASLIEEAQ